MPTEYWWIWMVLAALFVVGEIFTAAFFLLWFGVGAGVAGLLAKWEFGLVPQLTAFVVVSFALFLASRRFAERFSKEQPPGIGADRLVGQKGIVLEAIDNDKNTGRVRLGKEEWRADSETDAPIEVGKMVRVTGISGTHLIVTSMEGGE
ncbi:MAG: NfeD family protein [Candidatus Krumholzibacteriia bacterium]